MPTVAEINQFAIQDLRELSQVSYVCIDYMDGYEDGFENGYRRCLQNILDKLTTDPHWAAGCTAAAQLEYDFKELLPPS